MPDGTDAVIHIVKDSRITPDNARKPVNAVRLVKEIDTELGGNIGVNNILVVRFSGVLIPLGKVVINMLIAILGNK